MIEEASTHLEVMDPLDCWRIEDALYRRAVPAVGTC
jgi:hypothetical protein